MAPIDRRAFLATALALGAAPVASLLSACGRGRDPDADELAQLASQLVGELADDEGVSRLGRLYLEVAPDERDPAALALAISAGWPEAGREGARDVRRLLRQQARADFTRGRTVELDGWILSRTEARVSALAVLL